MSKQYCSHCSRLIVVEASESGPSVIRDGEYVYCNTLCYVGRTDKVTPKLNVLSIAVGYLGGTKVNSIIRKTVGNVYNKSKGFRHD